MSTPEATPASDAASDATPASDATSVPEADGPSSGKRPTEERYGVARDTLRAWLDSGVLVRDALPALYVYEQSGPGVLQRGLIGDVGLADPTQGVILPHEDVFPGPIADRLALMSTTQANLEPIFLLYNGDHGAATRLVDEVASTRTPLVDARTADGLHHRLWAITDGAEIDAVNTDLRTRQALIADGHHRYATYRILQRQEHVTHTTPEHPTPTLSQEARLDRTEGVPTPPHGPAAAAVAKDSPAAQQPTPAETTGQTSSNAGVPQASETPAQAVGEARASGPTGGPWDFGLALLVDSTAYPPNLQAIHRVIPGLPLTEATARAKGAWRVRDHPSLAEGLTALAAAAEPAFLLAGEGGTHLLTNPDPVQLAQAMPADRSDRWNSLNTSILTRFVMPKVWGMQDDEQSVRIVHHDAQAAIDLALRTGGTAVILKPLAVEDVLAVAAHGERVPRKSTSFGPKPRTGFVLRTFAAE
ncbi:DUF1015 family protein [Nonomuraea lactucae]|uniref:DUF1015 family protein n=1 Tax=Nonomuraea lactucae TaxID=2249762 RepID=UPI000DE3CBEA|nr:DUF1015 domain-containing protein [Nonomuraea lactucae]